MALVLVAFLAGLGTAKALDEKSEADDPPIARADPDPSSDSVRIGDAFTRAVESGDPEAIEEAAEAVRDEWLSRLGPEQREAAENSPPEAEVPPNTYAYISEHTTQPQAERCRRRLAEGHPDPLCELIVLHSKEEIEAGPYTKQQVLALLRPEGSPLWPK